MSTCEGGTYWIVRTPPEWADHQWLIWTLVVVFGASVAVMFAGMVMALIRRVSGLGVTLLLVGLPPFLVTYAVASVAKMQTHDVLWTCVGGA